MGIKHMTYLDLTPAQRREGAKAARDRLKGQLADPTLAPVQRKALLAQMVKIDQWEAGTLKLSEKS